MDIYAGSEPRQFISFHLDTEQSGQPTLQAVEPMEISQEISDDTEYRSTTSQIVKEDDQAWVASTGTNTSEQAAVGPVGPEVQKE